ncbi:hypothetical protein BDV25DRAFT_163824 [Aspergillus avenaceus]|uniref:Uncharacterized protein n=1 Tax=Aspergillus avenaceus TaxID=36643 RepID=A0A5N6THR7_ASPAV|nr:hypothetical protein BDV25DRAFT_163824 [Aspergillus avenaceus]
MEIRTKKLIKTHIFGACICSSFRRRDPTVLCIQHARPERQRKVNQPRCRILETREPKPPKPPSSITIRRSSPIRSRTLRFRLPFLDSVARLEREAQPDFEWESVSESDASLESDSEDTWELEDQDEFSRLFIVDHPDNEGRMYRRVIRSPSPKPRSIRAMPRVGIQLDHGENDPEVYYRYPRPRQRLGDIRPPRERTLVPEREPPRQGARLVEIHNDHIVSRSKERGRSPRRRQVRFSNNVEYVTSTNKAQGNKMREHERDRARSPDDHYSQSRHSGTRHTRPRIIHEGNNDLLETAENVYKEAWRPHKRESLLRNSNGSGSWRRCWRQADERVRYSRDQQQYGQRWR